jgi:DNA-binding CsgD family transcriptional regulator
MVGRRAELARLDEALEAAARGMPLAIVVSGEAGVGKTRLVREFTSGVRERGGRVWEGRCVPLTDGLLPYAPIVDVLRAVASETGMEQLREVAGSAAAGRLAVLLSDLAPRPAPTGGDRALPAVSRLYGDLVDLVQRLVADRTAVVVIEDLHWADGSTLALLSMLLGGRRNSRLLLICTYREGELPPDHPIRQLLAEWTRAGVDRMALRPLEYAETAALMAAILRNTPDPSEAERTFVRSGGNPFLVEELLAAGTLAEELRDILLMRVRRLPLAAQRVLRVVALSGRGVDHELVEQVYGGQVDKLVRTAVQENLLVVDGDRYGFRHMLVAEALVADMLPGEQVRLHRAFAEALAARVSAGRAPSTVAADQAELAYHWSAAGDRGRALVAAVAAGLAAEQVYAVPEARLHFEHALRLWQHAPHAHADAALGLAELYQHAAETASLVGDVDDALAYVRQAIDLVGEHGDPMQLGLLHERLGRYLRLSTAAEGAMIAAYQTAVALVPSAPGQVRARVLAGLASVLLLAGRIPESREWAEQALAVAREVGARQEEVHILSTLGVDLTRLGAPDEGIARLRDAVELGADLDDLDIALRAYTNLSHCLFVTGELVEAADVARSGAEEADRRGAARSFGKMLHGNASEALFYLGRWDEMAALLPETAEYDGNPMQCMVLGHATALLHTAQGRFDEADEHLNVARQALAPDAILERRVMLDAGFAELRLWQGRPAEALEWATAGLRAINDLEPTESLARLLAAAARARADLAQGSAETAALAALAALAARLPRQPALPAAHVTLARAELARARGVQDPRAWAAACDAWKALGCPYPLAYARWRHTEALLAARRRRDATVTLRGAYEAATDLGARPLLAELDRLADRARIHPAPADVERPPAYGLSRREVEVLRLIGLSYTNRQIATALSISEHTVSIHVSRVLTKLGVANRVAAALRAQRDGLLT